MKHLKHFRVKPTKSVIHDHNKSEIEAEVIEFENLNHSRNYRLVEVMLLNVVDSPSTKLRIVLDSNSLNTMTALLGLNEIATLNYERMQIQLGKMITSIRKRPSPHPKSYTISPGIISRRSTTTFKQSGLVGL